jgi:hypothetical protein
MLKLLEFNYSIEYKRGSENTVADALSRKYQTSDDLSLSVITKACTAISTVIPSWTADVSASYVDDPACTKLLEELSVRPDSKPKYTFQGGILRYKGIIYVVLTSNLREFFFKPSILLPLEAILGIVSPTTEFSKTSTGLR